MSAQIAAGTEGSLPTAAGEADTREPREGLPNGVTREERNAAVQGNDGSVALENPNAYDQYQLHVHLPLRVLVMVVFFWEL